jgi:glucose dehydrogenase
MRIANLRHPGEVGAIGRDTAGAGCLLVAMLLLLSDVPARGDEAIVELSQDDTQWVMPAKNYASTRFSGLDQITTENVGDLQLAWTFSTGLTPGHEAAPLVVGDTMYVVTPFPNILYALNTRDGSSTQLLRL